MNSITKFFLFAFLISRVAIFGQENFSQITLDQYLQQMNLFLSPAHSHVNEGYSTEGQRQLFAEELQKLPHVKTIAEIGFNAGHSCECFLKNPNITEVVTFDINLHPYVRFGVEFMQKNTSIDLSLSKEILHKLL